MTALLSSLILLLALSGVAQAEEATLPKATTCELKGHNTLAEVVEFYAHPASVLNLKTDNEKKQTKTEVDRQFHLFHEVGKVIAGPCKNAQIFVGLIDAGPACGKHSGSALLVYSDKGVPRPEYLKTELDDSDCTLPIRILVLGNRVIQLFDWDGDDYFKSYKKQFPNAVFENVKDGDYEEILRKDKTILVDGRSLSVKYNYGLKSSLFFETKDKKKIYSEKGYGDIYLVGRSGYLVLGDTTVLTVDLGLAGDPSNEDSQYGYAGLFDEQTKFKLSDLELVDSKSNAVMNLKNPDHPYLKEAFASYSAEAAKGKKTIAYPGNAYEGEINPISFEAYKKTKPFIFRHDKLGRIQVFSKVLYMVPYLAEPLIYVYSEKAHLMKIGFAGNVDVMVSRPLYKKGWSFETKPPNRIRMNNGRSIDSLFWEGTAGHIPSYRYGWTVRRDEIPKFLDKTLKSLGLNSKETRDFKKYWVPLLTKTEFYRIEFLPQEWMDRICEMKINPEPETLLRVHMRAYPLNSYILSEPPAETAVPKRKGLTVVEWSGFISAMD